MKLYVAMGTYEYLKKLKDTWQNQPLLFLENEHTCLLLHETEGESFFNHPIAYDILDRAGNLAVKKGVAVLHYIPVNDEGRPLIEYRLQNFSGPMTNVTGFEAIRVLRPLASNTYCLLTLWKNEADFKHWQASAMYQSVFSFPEANEKKKKEKKLPQIFPRPPYIIKYAVVKENTE